MLDETLYVQTQEAYEAHIEQEAYVRMVRYGSLLVKQKSPSGLFSCCRFLF